MAEIESQIGLNKPAGEESIEVDLFEGVKVKLPKTEAEKVIAGRQAAKEAQRKAAERLGHLEAEKEAATRAAKEATDRAEIERLQKAGEYQKAQEITEANYRAKLEKVSKGYAKTALAAEMAAFPDLIDDPQAREDLTLQLASSCKFNPETETVEVVGPDGRSAMGLDGKPLKVGDLIRSHIEKRSYLRRAIQTPGSGSQGSGPPPTANTMTTDQVAALARENPKALAKFFAEGGKQI